MASTPRTSSPDFPRWLPAVILGVSLVLRVVLALRGGQYFFGDEERYDRGIQLYRALAGGDLAGMREIIAMPEHALFPWVGAAVTAVQHLLAQLTRHGDWSQPENITFTMGLGAAVLSLFSTLNLFLLHRLARVAGATEAEAGWALLLMAASNTAFYFARHLLPYECAISAALAAMVVGLRAPTVARAFACGVGGALTYHLYNGYWYVVPVVWLAHALAHRQQASRVRLSLACAGGMWLALVLPVAAGWAAGGERYLKSMVAFSQSVTQGVFAEGWSLPWEYLWHSEGGLGVALVVGCVLAVGQNRRTRSPLPTRVTASLAVLLVAYLLLVALAVGLHIFVVYARTVKPLVPLFCLVGGWAFASLLVAYPRLRSPAFAGISLAAALHFAPHFTRIFPRDVEIAVLRTWGNPKHTLSVSGSLYIPLALPVTRPDLALVNVQLLYPIRAYLGYPAGETLLTIRHPLAYLPFQYESHTPRERTFLRSHDISIRLIRLAAPAALPSDLPAPMRYRTEDRPTGR